jgi:hypothetical protein
MQHLKKILIFSSPPASTLVTSNPSSLRIVCPATEQPVTVEQKWEVAAEEKITSVTFKTPLLYFP